MQPTKSLRIVIVSAACAAALVAQDSTGNWRRFGSPDANPVNAAAPMRPDDAAPQQARPYDQPPAPAGNYAEIPATLNLPSGAFVTVRVDQWLSSDKNQTGDTFYATLTQPVVVDGIVVARRGATVMGRVSDASKAGRVQGTSRLGLQLTNLTLVDGQQIPIQSGVIDRKGDTSVGSDAVAIGTTTGMGAAIGASVNGGVGAAVGAGIGAIVSSVGVMVTRGRATEVAPETMLTFRLEAPITISTAHASAAFHYADQQDYGSPADGQQARVAQRMAPRAVGPGYGAYPYPYYDPFYYGGFSLRIGPRYYGGYGYYRGGRR